jgi:spermidine/putrescine ABC transporter ATP-binding subunit
MGPEHPMISLCHVSRHYGAIRAVDDATFDIAAGEFFSLLGPSGCGKTTLLRMLGGFDTPTTGEIFIDGRSMAGVPANRRPTNMVFQNYAIFPHLSIRENIGYGLLNRAMSKAAIADRVDGALEMIHLGHLGDRRPHQLSGGQRQRVALARALVCEPKVLLLDEPLGALDKKLRAEMQGELRRIQRAVGITFVLVTHDQEEALTLSDRIAVMSAGQPLQIGDARTLYEAPENRAVAEFIGEMNFFPAEVQTVRPEGASVKVAGLGDFVVAARGPLAPGVEVTLALRPEKVVLRWDRPPQSAGLIEGRIVSETYLGDRCQYRVTIANHATPIRVVTQNSMPGNTPQHDRPVWLNCPRDAVLLLTD